MAKQNKAKPLPESIKKVELKDIHIQPIRSYKKWSLNSFELQALIVSLLAFIFYINTYNNEYAHDDGIVIVKNEYVQEGFDGIDSIFTKDAYASYYRQLNTVNQLSGGRYRPLSIVTFAIEQQFFGAVPQEKVDSVLRKTTTYGVRGPDEDKLVTQMHIRHLFNVLWYIISVVALLYFLRYIVFKESPIMAFVAAVLFTIHPIHTEVVANVKSRDEIMSLLFMCLTFICAFKFEENRKNWWWQLLALSSFFLAFLSKEYAITLLILLPVALFIYNKETIANCILKIIPYILVTTLYIYMRYNAVVPLNIRDNTSNTVLKNPLMIFVFIILLFVWWLIVSAKNNKMNFFVKILPFTLIFVAYMFIHNKAKEEDLAANPTQNETLKNSEQEVLNNPYLYAEKGQKLPTEIATSLSYLKLLVFPHPLSADYSYNVIPFKDFSNPLVLLSMLIHIALLFLMVYLFIKKNPLCFAIAFYLLHLLLVCNIIFDIGATMGERLIYHSSVGFVIAVAYFLVIGIEKIASIDLKNKMVIGCLLVLVVLCGFKTISRNADWKSDGTLFMQDINVVPNSILVNANVAATLISMSDLEKTDSVKKNQLLHRAIGMLDKAIILHKNTFVAGFLNRGIAYFKLGDIDKAKENLDSVKHLYPNYPSLKDIYPLFADYYMKNGWNSYGKYGKYAEAIAEFKKGISVDSTVPGLWYNLGGAYFSIKEYKEAIAAWQVCLKLKPDYNDARMGMQTSIAILNSVVPQTNKGSQKNNAAIKH